MSHRRTSRIAVVMSWKVGLLVAAFVAVFAMAGAALAQTQNLADHVQGYMLGDFESQSTYDFGSGPGIAPANPTYGLTSPGPVYTGPASAVLSVDSNSNPTGVWADFGDIQPQYYNTSNYLLYYQQSTAGATHGSKAYQAYNIFGGSTQDGSTSSFNGALELLNAGGDLQTAYALAHASALKFDVTYDRSLMQNAIAPNPDGTGPNPFAAFMVGINMAAPNGGGYFAQAHVSYDSLSTLNSKGYVTAQPNYEAGEFHYMDTATFPGTPSTATSYSQSPVVRGTGATTITLTVDFTTNLRNGADPNGNNGGNGDGNSSPTWKTYHNSILSNYNGVASGSFYNIFHIYYSLGTFYQGGIEIDNIRLILPGDFNQDGHVDASDISAAEAALANISGYEAAHNMKAEDMKEIGDVNGDGVVNNADLQALINSLKAGNGSTAPVPEPTSFALLGLGSALMVARHYRRRKPPC